MNGAAMSCYKSVPDTCPDWMVPGSYRYKGSSAGLVYDTEDLINEVGAIRIAHVVREYKLSYAAVVAVTGLAGVPVQKIGGVFAADEKQLLAALEIHGRPEGSVSREMLIRNARCNFKVLQLILKKFAIEPVRVLGDMSFYSREDLEKVQAEALRLKDEQKKFKVKRVRDSELSQKRGESDRKARQMQEEHPEREAVYLKAYKPRAPQKRRIKGTVPKGMSPIDYARVLRDKAHEEKQGVLIHGCLPLKACCEKFNVSYNTACRWRKLSELEGFTTERLTYVLVSCFEEKARKLREKEGKL
jgi:hypothetical protein